MSERPVSAAGLRLAASCVPDGVLQPVSKDDSDALHRLFLEPEVRRYLLDGEAVGRAWVEQVIQDSVEQFASDGTGLWTIAEPARAELLGVVGLREFFAPPRMQLIFALHPRWFGQGIAVCAARAVMKYLFEERQWRRVEAATDAPNVASVRVLEKLGFERFEPGDANLTSGAFGETLFFQIFAADVMEANE